MGDCGREGAVSTQKVGKMAEPWWGGQGLTAVAAHVDLQGAGAGAALAALRERTHMLIGVRILGLLI